MIPNHIHFIFFGFTEFQYIHYLAIKSAKLVHKPERIFLYYSQEPKNNELWERTKLLVELVHVDAPEEFNGVKLENYQYKADVLRLQKLIELGGIYLDIDVISVKPFGDLMNQKLVLGIETGDQDIESAESVTNAVILCEPNNPFIIDWLEETGKNLVDKHWAYHGVNLPAEMLKRGQYEVTLEPRQSFMPFGWRDRWIFDADCKDQLEGAYTMHLWETIWREDLDKINSTWVNNSDSTLAEILRSVERKLRIAVYTIAKNEEQFVERWAASNQEADLRLVCDTGSTDQTVELLKAKGVDVQAIRVLPWRFDTARGTALNLLPADIDICIWQDLDEQLLPGWREQLEQQWTAGATIANHRYRNNGNAWQWHSKIHARHGCIWTGAVHETLKWAIPEKVVWVPELYLDEYQDTGKNRRGYLTLLEKKIAEGDNNWRTYAFLAGEYQVQNMLDKALQARLKSHEYCDEGEAIKSYAAKNIGLVYSYMQMPAEAEHWFKQATDHSGERESWFRLTEFYYNNQRWEECYFSAVKCININQRRDGFTYDPAAWGHLPYDYAAIAAHNIGFKTKAVEYGRRALESNPADERLKKNLEYYEES